MKCIKIDRIIELDEFKKDFKKLKSYKKIKEDVENFKKILLEKDLFFEVIVKNLSQCANTGCSDRKFYVYKKFRSQDLKSTKDFRIVGFIKDKEIYLQEIYFKGKQEKEDYTRFKKYCSF